MFILRLLSSDMVCFSLWYAIKTKSEILWNFLCITLVFWVFQLSYNALNFNLNQSVTVINFREYTSNVSHNQTDISRQVRTKTLYAVTLYKDYLMNNDSICSSSKQISLLFWIHSSVNHFDNRNNIRSTFALRSRYLPEEVRVVFFIGKSVNNTDSVKLLQEQKRYGDIVQGDFLDSYHNLTHKAVMALRWIYEYCQSVKHVIKADDDVVFDTRMFFKRMATNLINEKKTMRCTVCPHSQIYRVGKWKVEPTEFKGYIHWPWPYCAGFVVLISNDLLTSMYRAAMIAPFMWVDDVYTFGILTSYIKGVKHRHFPFSSRLEEHYSRGKKCLVDQKISCNVIAVGAKTKTEFNTIWNLMQEKYKMFKGNSTL